MATITFDHLGDYASTWDAAGGWRVGARMGLREIVPGVSVYRGTPAMCAGGSWSLRQADGSAWGAADVTVRCAPMWLPLPAAGATVTATSYGADGSVLDTATATALPGDWTDLVISVPSDTVELVLDGMTGLQVSTITIA